GNRRRAAHEPAAAEIGVDPAKMREQVEAGAFRDAVARGIAEAHEIGIHAVPTYLFLRDGQPQLAIQGAQEWEVFQGAAAARLVGAAAPRSGDVQAERSEV